MPCLDSLEPFFSSTPRRGAFAPAVDLLESIPLQHDKTAPSTPRMTGTPVFDTAQLVRLQAGDKKVFHEVYHRYFGLVHYAVKRCGVAEEESLDIVQETFLLLYRKAGQIQQAESIKAWILTTARHLCLDYLRRQRAQRRLTQAQDVCEQSTPAPSDDPVRLELEVSLVGELIAAIERETQDDTLRLFYCEGWSAKRIADAKGEAISTVTTRLSRMRKRFRATFLQHLQQLRDES